MKNSMLKKKVASLALLSGIVLQAGSCNFGEITTAVTIDGRTAIITLIRAAIFSPIEEAVGNAIDNFFDEDE